MVRKTITLALLGFVALIGVASSPGCGGGGSDCESICNDEKSGGCITNPSDCAKFCADYTKIAQEAGCAAKFNAEMDCYAKLADVCSNTSCDNAVNAVATCSAPYCAKHASECAALNKD